MYVVELSIFLSRSHEADFCFSSRSIAAYRREPPSIVAPSNPQTKPLAQFQARVNKALEKEPVQVASVTFVNTIDDTVPADFEYVESELKVHPTVSVRPTQRSAGVACSECLHCRDLTDEQRATLSGLQGEVSRAYIRLLSHELANGTSWSLRTVGSRPSQVLQRAPLPGRVWQGERMCFSLLLDSI